MEIISDTIDEKSENIRRGFRYTGFFGFGSKVRNYILDILRSIKIRNGPRTQYIIDIFEETFIDNLDYWFSNE